MNTEEGAPVARRKRVLNTGSGPLDNTLLHPAFRNDSWQAIRLDIDPNVKPDLIGTIQDMRGLVLDQSVDAVWSSHSLEHLYAHEVLPALMEFRRILREDGFALITCPDLEAVAKLLLERGLDRTVYVSPAGPIAVADMLFGHRLPVARGNVYMSHKTGFTAESLGRLVLEAGFPEVHIGQGDSLDLWAVACMPEARLDVIGAMLDGTRQAFLVPA